MLYLQVLDDTLRTLFQHLLELDSLEIEPDLELVELLLVLDVFLEDSLLQNLIHVLLSTCLGLFFLINERSESAAHLIWAQLIVLERDGLDVFEYV